MAVQKGASFEVIGDVSCDNNTCNYTDTQMLKANMCEFRSQLAFNYSYTVYRIVIDIFVVSLVCIIGFIGNTLTIIVLHRDPDKKNTTNCLLQALAVSDLGYLLACVFYQVLKAIHDYTNWWPGLQEVFPYLEPYIWAFASTAATITVWLVVLVTLDRYIAVCLPMKQKLRSVGYARAAVVLIVAFGLFYNIPRFFERRTLVTREICTNKTVVKSVKTDLRESNVYFLVYKTVLYFIFRAFGPFITLLILNFRLIKALKEVRRRRLEMNKRTRNRENITLMLVVVVTVFLVCEIPDLVLRIVYTLKVYIPSINLDVVLLRYINAITNLLLTINSSINFLIYCLIGNKFRKMLKKLCCHGGDSSLLDMSETDHAPQTRTTATQNGRIELTQAQQGLPLLEGNNVKDVSL